ncbi:hypothetical protein AS030_11330 [Fictibacillus enclensis]|uniref:Uncharacterized protein n=1 Tax=Fictibacillus enclensis TaxID=1017270 RepID=A0A0V8J939_9BACL|nr:hypothetical protein AS030_11330 [Fictibacillus enclensis]
MLLFFFFLKKFAHISKKSQPSEKADLFISLYVPVFYGCPTPAKIRSPGSMRQWLTRVVSPFTIGNTVARITSVILFFLYSFCFPRYAKQKKTKTHRLWQ